MSCGCSPSNSPQEPTDWNSYCPITDTPTAITPDAFNEFVNFQIPMNQQLFEIPFVVLKSSANYIAHGPMIENTTDLSPLIPSFIITSRTPSTVQIALSGLMDTNNYYFKSLFSVVA